MSLKNLTVETNPFDLKLSLNKYHTDKGGKTQQVDNRLAYELKTFLRLLDFGDLLSEVENLKIIRVDSVDGVKVSVIKKPIDDLTWEEFYISAEKGFLLKRVIYVKTPVAITTIEAVFGNFRDVDGLQVAHNLKYETGTLLQFTLVEPVTVEK